MKCFFAVGAVVALLLQVTAGRELPFRRNAVASKRQQQLNSPFNLRNQGDSQENPSVQDGYYAAENAEEPSDDYAQYDQGAASQEDGQGQQGSPFGNQPQESIEDRPNAGGEDKDDFTDFQGFGKDSLPADIPMKFEGPLPDLKDTEAEKSNGFIFGAPAGFPSLNDFGGFQGNFGDDPPQASDEGQQVNGGQDAGADYSDDGSDEQFNSPAAAAAGGGRPGAGGRQPGGFGRQQFERQAGASHYAPGRPHAFESAPSQGGLMWTK